MDIRKETDKEVLAIVLGMLGEDRLDVLERLRRMGIRGVKRSACGCPIANYLLSLGYTDVSVGTVSATVWDYGNRWRDSEACSLDGPTAWSEGPHMPQAVVAFIDAFDHDRYYL